MARPSIEEDSTLKSKLTWPRRSAFGRAKLKTRAGISVSIMIEVLYTCALVDR